MRINLKDCDVSLPTESDISDNLDALLPEIKNHYIPFPSMVVGKLWYNLVDISVALGNILRTHYRIQGPRSNLEEIEISEKELASCAPITLSEGDISHPCMRVFDHQVRLFYQYATNILRKTACSYFRATVVVLHRSYVLQDFADMFAEGQEQWRIRFLNKARAAAANTNSVLEKLMSLDLVRYMKPMT